MLVLLIGLGAAAAAVVALGGGAAPAGGNAPKVGGPQVGTIDDWAGPVLAEGESMVRYLGGRRVAAVDNQLPTLKFGKGIVGYVTGAVQKLLDIIDASYGGDGTAYPTGWTEEPAQLDELGAVMLPIGSAITIELVAFVQSGWGENGPWHNCGRFVWATSGVTATTVLWPDVVDKYPIGPVPAEGSGDWGDVSSVPCLYAWRQYTEAGAGWDTIERPGPPDWLASVSVDNPGIPGVQRMALVLYTPPRLGQIRTLCKWVIRRTPGGA